MPLARPVAGVLAVPEGAVASIEWSGSAAGAGRSGSERGELPEELDPQGADAGAVAAVLAAASSEARQRRRRLVAERATGWGRRRLPRGVGGLRRSRRPAAVGPARPSPAILSSTQHGSAYLEPDVQAARTALAGTARLRRRMLS